MDTVLWVVQAILAIKLISTAWTHGLRQSQPDMAAAMQKMGRSAPLLHGLTAAGTLAGALGLILPGLLGAAGGVSAVAAALLAIMLLASAGLHARSRAKPNLFVSLILAALAAFVAYGRGASGL